MLQSMGSQRVTQDWVTKQQQKLPRPRCFQSDSSVIKLIFGLKHMSKVADAKLDLFERSGRGPAAGVSGWCQ